MAYIDLNCDMGEGFGPWQMGDDSAMLDIITSANIACGWHAGDPNIMHKTAELAKEKGVAIGAHPGFGDLWGFGRRVIRGDSMADLEKQMAYQIGAMQALAIMAGHKVTHVKPHGALGNLVADEEDMALAVGRAMKAIDPNLIYVVMPGLAAHRAAEKLGLRPALEIFADRAYDDSGNLVSRKIDGAVIHDADFAATRVVQMVESGTITALSGKTFKVDIDTICVHGDTPTAVDMARKVRKSLEKSGLTLKPFCAA